MKTDTIAMFLAQKAKQQVKAQSKREKPLYAENNTETFESEQQYRILVPEAERLNMLPKYFGNSGFGLTFDHKFFNQMRKLCPEYDGGYWDYYKLWNGGFYMSWSHDEPITVYDPNGGPREMSADAASVAVGLILYSNCCAYFYENNQTLSNLFYSLHEQLYDYAYTHHPEGSLIRSIAN